MSQSEVTSVVFLNNSKNRKHADIFRDSDAFFDLNTTGYQAKLARNLPVGQICIVISNAAPNVLQFDWWSLREILLPTENGDEVRVFLGDRIFEESKTKSKAAKSRRYGQAFNRVGNLKRPSVTPGKLESRFIPTTMKPPNVATPEEVGATSVGYVEGAVREIKVNSFERSSEARSECLQKHGYRCSVCHMSFKETYGDEFSKLIHVHHLKPISEVGKEYVIDGNKDLRPVCPNCHAVIHYGGKLRSIEQVRRLLKSQHKN